MSKAYQVGFGRPPKHTQFAKGRSGNPRGRPKGTKNLKTDLSEELQEVVMVREGGREKALSKQRVMIKSLMGKAMKGDQGAVNTVINLMARLFDVTGEHADDEPLTEDELTIVENLKARLTREQGRAPGKTLAGGRRVRKRSRRPVTKG